MFVFFEVDLWPEALLALSKVSGDIGGAVLDSRRLLLLAAAAVPPERHEAAAHNL